MTSEILKIPESFFCFELARTFDKILFADGCLNYAISPVRHVHLSYIVSDWKACFFSNRSIHSEPPFPLSYPETRCRSPPFCLTLSPKKHERVTSTACTDALRQGALRADFDFQVAVEILLLEHRVLSDVACDLKTSLGADS